MRILWLKTELLHPVDKGGRIRTYHMLRHLAGDHHVTYLTLDDGSAAPDARERAAEYCDDLVVVPHRVRERYSPGFYGELALNLASPLPYFLQRWRSPEMRRQVERRAREEYDVVVCDFLVPAVNLPEGVPCGTVLFQHNVEADIWKRHRDVASNPLKKAFFHLQWRKTRAFEARACRRFDRVVAVSGDDRETMEEEYGARDVATVPTGVDTEYFRPSGRAIRPAHMVFTGSMDWLPNEDAVRFFAREVLPRVRERFPDATFSVVGRDPTPAVRELGRADEGIEVTGWVDDVRPWMEEAGVYVVPLRIGGGTRLKIYEAMAMEKPVVSTSVGREGLPVRHGDELLVADDAGAFADAVIRLLEDPDEARAMGRRAARRVRRDFGWAGVAEAFAGICREVAAGGEEKDADDAAPTNGQSNSGAPPADRVGHGAG